MLRLKSTRAIGFFLALISIIFSNNLLAECYKYDEVEKLKNQIKVTPVIIDESGFYKADSPIEPKISTFKEESIYDRKTRKDCLQSITYYASYDNVQHFVIKTDPPQIFLKMSSEKNVCSPKVIIKGKYKSIFDSPVSFEKDGIAVNIKEIKTPPRNRIDNIWITLVIDNNTDEFITADRLGIYFSGHYFPLTLEKRQGLKELNERSKAFNFSHPNGPRLPTLSSEYFEAKKLEIAPHQSSKDLSVNIEYMPSIISDLHQPVTNKNYKAKTYPIAFALRYEKMGNQLSFYQKKDVHLWEKID